MNVALWLVLLMLGTQLGAALSHATEHWCVVLVGLAAAVLLICRQFSLSRWKLFVLVVVLGGLLLRSLTGQSATPTPRDPLQFVPSASDQMPLVIEGRALADAPVRRERCQALLQVNYLSGQVLDGRCGSGRIRRRRRGTGRGRSGIGNGVIGSLPGVDRHSVDDERIGAHAVPLRKRVVPYFLHQHCGRMSGELSSDILTIHLESLQATHRSGQCQVDAGVCTRASAQIQPRSLP